MQGFLSQSGALIAVEELRHLDLNWVAVYTVIDTVIGNGIAVERIRICLQRSIGQIKGLTACAGREERSVAFGGSLHNLVAYGEQIRRIFASLLIRTDDNTLLLKERMGISDCLQDCITRQIIRVVDYLCGVVAFEHDYQPEIIAKVICA